MKLRAFIFSMILGAYLVFIPAFFSTSNVVKSSSCLLAQESEPSTAPPPDVDIEIGPRLTDEDQSVIDECVSVILASTFPFDFVYSVEALNTSESITCPHIELFDSVFEVCYLVDAYVAIRPAVLAGFFIWAIIAL